MTDYYILNDTGEPVPEPDIQKWARWHTKAPRWLAIADEPNATIVTWFTGIDRVPPGGMPLLWETNIFGFPHGGYRARYATAAEALAGHARAVALVKGESP